MARRVERPRQTRLTQAPHHHSHPRRGRPGAAGSPMTPPIPILYRYQHDIGRDIYYVLVERSHRALFSSDHRPKSQDDPLHTVTHDRSVVNYSRISHNDIHVSFLRVSPVVRYTAIHAQQEHLLVRTCM